MCEVMMRKKESWIVSDLPEAETQCSDCDAKIIFFVYQEGNSGAKRAVPRRCRACVVLYGEYRVRVKAAKIQIKREQGVKRVSKKKLDEVLNELAAKKSRKRWQQKPKKKMLSRKKIDSAFESLEVAE